MLMLIRAFAARGLIVGLALVLLQGRAAAQAEFRRGDANVDGVVDIADVYFIFAKGFIGEPVPTCQAAMDVDWAWLLPDEA